MPVLAALGLALYFLPALLAYACGLPGARTILLLITQLSWTVLAQIAAIVWAVAVKSDESAGKRE